MSAKSTFENHPVVWGLGLIVVGFGVGFGARGYVLPVSAEGVTCMVEGLSALEEAHAKDVAVLNAKLLEFEGLSSDHNLISPYQAKYKESANSIRADLERSNRVYLAAIDALAKKCK
jgi:hypothetical protein